MSDDEYVETILARQKSAPPIRLRHCLGSLQGTLSQFDGGIVHLGRRRDCELRFDSHQDRMVSSRHARLSAEDGRWFLEDLESTNGTLVNGKEIVGRIALATGDQVILGIEGSQGSVGFAIELLKEAVDSPAPSDDEGTEEGTLEARSLAAQSSRPVENPAPAPERSRIRNPQRAHELAARVAAHTKALEVADEAAGQAATVLARALWLRGGVDWSRCPSVAKLLDLERRAHAVSSMLDEALRDEQADRESTLSTCRSIEARIAAMDEELTAAKAARALAENAARSNDDALREHCDDLFATLDELSLVIAETIAKHRPSAEDDVATDLEALRERLARASRVEPAAAASLASFLAERVVLRARIAESIAGEDRRARAILELRGDLDGEKQARERRRLEREATLVAARSAKAAIDAEFGDRFRELGNEVLNGGPTSAPMPPEFEIAASKRAALESARHDLEDAERDLARDATESAVPNGRDRE